VFLDEKTPAWQPGVSPRVPLAEWVTARDNPFFARTAVNRVWGLLFGRGIVDPVDDFNNDNPPSHPELLDDVARDFADAGFDLKFLIRAIGRTRAYQRTSARTDASQDDPRLFARMAVKGLTGEQLYDSLALVTGTQQRAGGRGRGPNRGNARDQFLTQFALTGKPSEPETSIPQALTLMNGRFVNDATTLDTSPTLQAVGETPGLTTAGRIEALYVATLGRKPTPTEADRLQDYVAEAGSERRTERLADVFWTLLNSAEFRLNH
jgi:hypothetical protein